MKMVPREQLKKYRDVVEMWSRKFNTAEIGEELNLPESLVARWVANFRDVMREAGSAQQRQQDGRDEHHAHCVGRAPADPIHPHALTQAAS